MREKKFLDVLPVNSKVGKVCPLVRLLCNDDLCYYNVYFAQRKDCELIIETDCMVVKDFELVANRLFENNHVYADFLIVPLSTFHVLS